MPKKSKDEKIEISPLLSKSRNGGDDEKPGMKVPNMGMASPFHSTVNSEKFDMRRFSDRRDDEESSLKIIIYVVLVIIIGVGLALFVRQVISNNESNGDETENTDTATEEETSNVLINTEPKSDSLAPTSTAESYVFGTEESTTLGSADSTETLTVEKLAYDRYSTFGQLSLSFQDGLALESVPEIAVTYNADNQQIKVAFPEDTIVDEDIQAGAVVSDAISSVSYNDANKTLTISLDEATEYRTTLISVGTVPTMIVDVKVAEEEEEEVIEEPAETTEEPETTPDPSAPTGINLDNEYSQEKQFIVSSVTGNTIPYDKTYFTDAVDHFELAFGKVGNLGDEYIPNVSAELVEEDGTNYLDVTISNLASFDFDGITASQTGLDLSAANFVRADLESFSNGKAVVRITLKNRADFKIASETTINGQTQVLGIRIKD